MIYDPERLSAGLPGVAAVVLVGRAREVVGVNASTVGFDVTSYRGEVGRAGPADPWPLRIENYPHWTLYEAFRED